MRAEEEWDATAEVIERWESPSAGDMTVFGSREDDEEYLAVAACLASAPGPRTEATLQVVMARLDDESLDHASVSAPPPTETTAHGAEARSTTEAGLRR